MGIVKAASALGPAGRFALVANVVAGAAALAMAALGDGGTRVGPARTDDLPYGDLISLNRSGALVWLAAALVGALAALLPRLWLRAAAAGCWFGLALVAIIVVVAEGELLGMSRPGNIAVCVGLGLSVLLRGPAQSVGSFERKPNNKRPVSA